MSAAICGWNQRVRWLLVLCALLLTFAAQAADVPYLTGRVMDNAEILSAAARDRLTDTLKQHELATGNQIAVLTVPSLEGDSVEDFAQRVFQDWKLGQKDKDNGVLVVVASGDRRMRIEVGYGLEGTLTDVAAGRIIRNIMTPRFKDSDYDGGVEAGVAAIIGALNGEVPAADAAADAAADGTANGNEEFFKGPQMPLTERILVGGFIFGIIGLFTIIGILTPGVGWFLYLFLIPFWSMFPIMVVGAHATLVILVTYLVGYPLIKLFLARSDWYKKAASDLRTKGTAQVGGFTLNSAGSSGSDSSSWSSGGSSFSGGGGSSGGGGASGSW